MKQLQIKHLLYLLIFLFISCYLKEKKENYCLKKAEYFPLSKMLVPESAIKLYIQDRDSVLQKRVNLETAKKILFYSVKEKDRNQFHLVTPQIKSFQINNGIITISVLTAYFRPNIYIDGVRQKNKWTHEQIKKVIENDIGIIFDKDTILIKNCNCKS